MSKYESKVGNASAEDRGYRNLIKYNKNKSFDYDEKSEESFRKRDDFPFAKKRHNESGEMENYRRESFHKDCKKGNEDNNEENDYYHRRRKDELIFRDREREERFRIRERERQREKTRKRERDQDRDRVERIKMRRRSRSRSRSRSRRREMFRSMSKERNRKRSLQRSSLSRDRKRSKNSRIFDKVGAVKGYRHPKYDKPDNWERPVNRDSYVKTSPILEKRPPPFNPKSIKYFNKFARADEYKKNFDRRLKMAKDIPGLGPARKDRFSYDVLNSGIMNSRIDPCKIFVGRIARGTTEEELREKFQKYGDIVSLQWKVRFAFIEYARPEHAKSAIMEENEKLHLGEPLSVQPHYPGGYPLKYERRRQKFDSMSYRNTNYDTSYIKSGQRFQKMLHYAPHKDNLDVPLEKRKQFRILLRNVDQSASWKDLKDFGREVSTVNYSNIIEGQNGEKIGIIEYFNLESVEKAKKILNGREFCGKPAEVIDYDESLVRKPTTPRSEENIEVEPHREEKVELLHREKEKEEQKGEDEEEKKRYNVGVENKEEIEQLYKEKNEHAVNEHEDEEYRKNIYSCSSSYGQDEIQKNREEGEKEKVEIKRRKEEDETASRSSSDGLKSQDISAQKKKEEKTVRRKRCSNTSAEVSEKEHGNEKMLRESSNYLKSSEETKKDRASLSKELLNKAENKSEDNIYELKKDVKQVELIDSAVEEKKKKKEVEIIKSKIDGSEKNINTVSAVRGKVKGKDINKGESNNMNKTTGAKEEPVRKENVEMIDRKESNAEIENEEGVSKTEVKKDLGGIEKIENSGKKSGKGIKKISKIKTNGKEAAGASKSKALVKKGSVKKAN